MTNVDFATTESGEFNTSNDACFRCGKKGHYIYDCLIRNKDYFYDDPLVDPDGNPTPLVLDNVPLPEYCDPNDVITCLLPYGQYNPGIGAPFAIILRYFKLDSNWCSDFLIPSS